MKKTEPPYMKYVIMVSDFDIIYQRIKLGYVLEQVY